MSLRVRQTQATTAHGLTAEELAWWVPGDAPVRLAEAAIPLVDGRAAMLAMCVAFLSARESIWLGDWGLCAPMSMVRASDQRAGPDGSPEQRALLDRLRAARLDDEALAFWQAGHLRVVDVLGFAVRRGVQVHVLLWGPINPFGLLHIVNDPHEQRRMLEAQGVLCRLDKSSRSPLHVAQAIHQKCATVDGRLAFVGGIDLTIEVDGDFDRWDTPAHRLNSPVRKEIKGRESLPWHDLHVLLTGDPAEDVERNLRQRWRESARGWWQKVSPPLHHLARSLIVAEHRASRRDLRIVAKHEPPQGAGLEVSGPPARLQVVRTIPALTYRFAPRGIYGIAHSYAAALRQARQIIYMESQYFWLEGFTLRDLMGLGWQSRHMLNLARELAAAAERGAHVALLLPDHPNIGRNYTDGALDWLRRRAPQAYAEGRLHAFCLGTSDTRADGTIRYRPIYVHAKVATIDDRWATIGSANLNSRGASHDAELNVSVLDGEFSRGLRTLLWAEHLGMMSHADAGWPAPGAIPLPAPLTLPSTEGPLALCAPLHEGLTPFLPPTEQARLATLDDPVAGLRLLEESAQANLERVRRGEPLVGNLLPYVRHAEGRALGLNIHKESGLLDPLRAPREGERARHVGKYT